jgi:histidinol-phosphatase (PHP family)
MIGPFFALDYQVHSYCSHDGRADIRDQCRRAVEIGLDEIGFSEHKDFDPADSSINHFDYDDYRAQIEAAREEFNGKLIIRMGVEVDYQRWFEESIADFLAAHEFDFVIGSVHYVDQAMLMTEPYMRGRTCDEAYEVYFEALIDSVSSGLIDILGHMEYANKRGIRVCGGCDRARFGEQVERLFAEMVDENVALEINTAGLRHGVGCTYPCAYHIRKFTKRGGRLLTIGSDAHHPDDLAADYALAAGLALGSGLSDVAVYEMRKPRLRPLLEAESAPILV